MSLPPEHCVRLDDAQDSFPPRQPAREQDDERACGMPQARPFDAAVEHDALLAEHGVFDDQLGRTAGHGIDAPESACGARRRGPRPEMVVDHLYTGSDHLPRPVQQRDEAGVRLLRDELVVGRGQHGWCVTADCTACCLWRQPAPCAFEESQVLIPQMVDGC